MQPAPRSVHRSVHDTITRHSQPRSIRERCAPAALLREDAIKLGREQSCPPSSRTGSARGRALRRLCGVGSQVKTPVKHKQSMERYARSLGKDNFRHRRAFRCPLDLRGQLCPSPFCQNAHHRTMAPLLTMLCPRGMPFSWGSFPTLTASGFHRFCKASNPVFRPSRSTGRPQSVPHASWPKYSLNRVVKTSTGPGPRCMPPCGGMATCGDAMRSQRQSESQRLDDAAIDMCLVETGSLGIVLFRLETSVVVCGVW